MALTFKTTKGSSVAVVAALVCLANPGVTHAQALRGVCWLASQHWGAAVQGDGYTTFKVPEDWDGACFVGYFIPSLGDVAQDVGPGFWELGPLT
jgi:hypothetical protein